MWDLMHDEAIGVQLLLLVILDLQVHFSAEEFLFQNLSSPNELFVSIPK